MTKNNIQIVLSTWLYGDLAGCDEFDNQYYQDKRRQVSLKKHMRRWVIYAKEVDPTCIPATWYGWLHAQCDTVLMKSSKTKITLIQQQNNTGTINAYWPPLLSISDTAENYSVKGYQAWQPDKN